MPSGFESPLTKSARYGYAKIVKLLINARADINHVNSFGDTALTLAEQFKVTDEGM
jgi:ankyrin repeat protein